MGIDAAIQAEGLIKNFGETKALADFNLSVPRGSVFGCSAQRRGQDNGRAGADHRCWCPMAARAWVLGAMWSGRPVRSASGSA